VELPIGNKNYVVMMFLFTRTMPFAYKEKCFKLIKFFQSENELNKFIQTTVGRNGLMVLCTISCEKLTKLVQLNEKPSSGRPRSARTQRNISRVSPAATHSTIDNTILVLAKVLAKSTSYFVHLLQCSVV